MNKNKQISIENTLKWKFYKRFVSSLMTVHPKIHDFYYNNFISKL